MPAEMIEARFSRDEQLSARNANCAEQLMLQKLARNGAPVTGTTHLELKTGTLEVFHDLTTDEHVAQWHP